MLQWLIFHAVSVLAAATCGNGSKCPQESPCCSPYGDCGVGAYCLGGCDPVNSFSRGSCVDNPVCQNETYTFANLDGLQSIDKYLGDETKADFVYSGQPLNNNGDLLLTMANNSVGTVISSTKYIWYGKFSAKLKTSRGRGVITAFITMSDAKDEIDFEFVGADLSTAQTNYYHLGYLDYHNSYNISSLSDTFENYHTYEIDWTPDQITWSIDGKVGRTKKRSDTWNATTGQYDYPQTPARLQLSLWPGGLASNPPGTIAWAGGVIDWNSADIQQHGYYYVSINQISVECYAPLPGTKITGSNSYVYADDKFLNSSIQITGDPHVLASFQATGTNLTAGNSTSSSTSSAATSSATKASIPGQGSLNNGGTADAERGGSIDNSAGSSNVVGTPSAATTGFSQGIASPSSQKSSTDKLAIPVFLIFVATVAFWLC